MTCKDDRYQNSIIEPTFDQINNAVDIERSKCIQESCWICRGQCDWENAHPFRQPNNINRWAHEVTAPYSVGVMYCHASLTWERAYRERLMEDI